GGDARVPGEAGAEVRRRVAAAAPDDRVPRCRRVAEVLSGRFGMNRTPTLFELLDGGLLERLRAGRREGSDERGGREIPGSRRSDPPAREPPLRLRSGLRRAGVRHEALHLQQVAVLLAARADPRLRAARKAQETLGGGLIGSSAGPLGPKSSPREGFIV